ncbi:MAG: hypothetical protein DCC67_09580 [Planctomycetota bacterium]|nr:MAG: hypothetical protein DCC67_09580 [Planctomycetota bacterium]
MAALPAARATAWPPVIVRGTASPMPPRTYAAPATVAGNATAVPGNRPTAWGPGPHAWIEPSMAQPRTADLRTQSPFFNPPPQ